MKASEFKKLIREEIRKSLKEDATYHADILNKWDANPKWMVEDLVSMATDLMRRGMGEELEVLIKALEKAIPELKKKRGM
jgi:hypothetical protein